MDMATGKKIGWTIITILVLGLMALIYFKYFFVFGEGVKTGHLNYAVRKGNIFKTYEGKLIQAGFKSQTAGSIQSYEFEFSIKNKRVFEMLERNSGKSFDLHYKEYHGIVPWRGNTVYLVDSVIAMREE
jgi:hypothetical protein